MALQEEAGSGGCQLAPARGRRSGRRRLWRAILCFGGCCGEESEAGTPLGRLRRRKRTVPVDGAGDEVASSTSPGDREMRHSEEEAGGGPRRRRGCCFLLPLSCFPGLKRNVKRSNSNVDHGRRRRQQETTAPPPSRPRDVRAPPAKLPPPPRRGIAPATTRGAIAETGRGTGAPSTTTTSQGEATAPRAAASVDASASDAVTREFGPVVGVSVLAAVSMAGLLGGQLWAVICVCAWFAALYGLQLKRRRQKAPPAAANDGGDEGVVVDVNSKDYKKLIVLKGLLHRDRR